MTNEKSNLGWRTSVTDSANPLFDAWLRTSLQRLNDEVLAEPLPDALLSLIDIPAPTTR